MSDYTVAQLLQSDYTLNEVDRMADSGRIGVVEYWAYFHEWKQNKLSNYTACQCLVCRPLAVFNRWCSNCYSTSIADMLGDCIYCHMPTEAR